MHLLVERIEKLFLPDLEPFASHMQKRFPHNTFNVWQWPTGITTDYTDYDLCLDCLFPASAEAVPDNVALMIQLRSLHARPCVMADIVWAHPSGHSEAAFREKGLGNAEWPETKPETIEELKGFLPSLFQVFESAVERGVPPPSRTVSISLFEYWF
jgi:hypothetical protein